jgi:hypothetical protein
VTVYKFIEVINKDALDPNMPASDAVALDESISADKIKIVAKKQNAVTIAHLLMTFTSEGGPWVWSIQGNDHVMAGWSGTPCDQGAVQELSVTRYGDGSGAATNAQQDWNEERCGSCYILFEQIALLRSRISKMYHLN